MIADKTYWLNADKTKAVEDGDPDAAFLLVAEGGAIDPAEAEKYGLKFNEKPAAEGEEPTAPPPAPSRTTKRSTGPSEDK